MKRDESSLLGIVGIAGFGICLAGVIEGYLNGWLGDHRYIRRMLRAFEIFLIACLIVVMISEPAFDKISPIKETNTAIPIVQAAETEKPDSGKKKDKESGPEKDIVDPNAGRKTESTKEEKKEPLDDSPIELHSIYAEQGSTVSFKAYHPKAAGYTWEVYDPQKDVWEWVPLKNVHSREDELFREVSVCDVVADREQSVRCQVSISQNPPVKYEADLHVLTKEIREIQADDIRIEAKNYIAAKDIPVKVFYQDGSIDAVTGLDGLYFLRQEETTEHSITASGNLKDTTTTVRTACEYTFAELGTQDCILCYKKTDEAPITISVTGMDIQAPQIEGLDISSITMSNEDKPVPIMVRIKASDDLTPAGRLEYAFLPEGHEPGDEDWKQESSFEAKVSNGTWKAYCRDQSGNVTTKEQEILVVDTVAPVIELELENKEWCTKNRIYVSVEDSLPVEYRYQCEKEDSGWIKEAVKDVDQNGSWNIQVRDAAGNVSEQEITVANIDKQPPVIRGITEKAEGEAGDNEK